MVKRLRDAQLYGCGFGHADVTLTNGSVHRVTIGGVYPDFILTSLDGKTIRVDNVREVAYDDVNGH